MRRYQSKGTIRGTQRESGLFENKWLEVSEVSYRQCALKSTWQTQVTSG